MNTEALTADQIAHLDRKNMFCDVTQATADIVARRLRQALTGRKYTYISDVEGADEMTVRTGVTLTDGDAVTVKRDENGAARQVWLDQTSFLIWIDLNPEHPPQVVFETVRWDSSTVIHVTQYDGGQTRNRIIRFVLIVPPAD